MYNNEHNLECKIHRFEDKLLRSKHPSDQMELQNILMSLRKELQNLKWKNSKREACIRLSFFIRVIYKALYRKEDKYD